MNDKTRTPTELQNQDSPEKKQPAKTGKKTQQKPSLSKVGILGCLLALVALAGTGVAGYYGYQQLQLLPTREDVSHQLQNSLSKIEKTVRTIPALTTEVKELKDQNNRLVSRIDALNRKLARIQGTDRSDWLLAEAEYLMRLANQRLLTMQDTNSAMALLAQADVLLQDIDEYGLFNVRKALAEDQAALRATSDLDRDGIWLELNALVGRIDLLPLLPEDGFHQNPDTSSNEQTSLTTDDSPTPWQDKLKTSAVTAWNRFAGQFRINRGQARSETVLLSPDEELFLRQNLRLMLEQAQAALLQERTAVYRSSLMKAGDWIDQWFLNESEESQAIKNELTRLIDTDIQQVIPDISRSLVSLKAYVDDAAKQRIPVKPAPDTSASSASSTGDES